MFLERNDSIILPKRSLARAEPKTLAVDQGRGADAGQNHQRRFDHG